MRIQEALNGLLDAVEAGTDEERRAWARVVINLDEPIPNNQAGLAIYTELAHYWLAIKIAKGILG